MSYWTVAQTEAQRESVAERHLQGRGYATYLPRIKRRKFVEPLFPGYIFIRVEDIWYPIKATIGVIRVLTSGENPACLRDDVMAEIRGREDRRGFIQLPKHKPRQGQKVRIRSGTFADHVGIYEGQSGKDREKVLLALLGRMVSVETTPANLLFAS